ncbi:hypothetical protein BM43_4975 [Burkholderia gladioli]|uniref:Uncharacterized protein n=1 Tax=Burkholderia gladioli TaxID=28095 RepID=A0AAW3EZG9_BURGA|nr:hypothetical protein [Burkholderia gladioli]ASD82247.1 hypothetical protein CEJ98_25140 [Burkholderia gladioli pv. gladioli]AJW96049.1 hypothetical protein BM43_4975 [Burkholderia gladioli]AWY52499.1 hypothetical protein A8H28_15675 [Burkholderia gladioli pv. gladioli]KGC13005.1 hypothetical protein DM48_2791 [Burkholderia gladioli]SQA90985.1 Uncharacterised protein [Burkholderia gladioli]
MSVGALIGRFRAAPEPADAARTDCARCAHWADDRALLEARIGGLASFSSGYGASVGRSRLCLKLDRLVSPGDRCGGFVEREAEHDAS